jgi:hypothetical protein
LLWKLGRPNTITRGAVMMFEHDHQLAVDAIVGPRVWSAVLTDAVAGTGAFVVLSDDLATYTDAEWAVVERLRATQPSLDTTLDLDDPFADPVVVRAANGSTLTVDWREPRASLDVRQV